MEESHHKEDSSQKRSRITYLLKDNLLHANSKLHYTSCSSIFSLNVRRILCRSLRSAIHIANMEIRKCVKWSRVRGVKNMGTINLQPKNCSLSLIEKSNAVVLSCWSIVSFTDQIQHAPLPDCSPKFKPPVFLNWSALAPSTKPADYLTFETFSCTSQESCWGTDRHLLAYSIILLASIKPNPKWLLTRT